MIARIFGVCFLVNDIGQHLYSVAIRVNRVMLGSLLNPFLRGT